MDPSAIIRYVDKRINKHLNEDNLNIDQTIDALNCLIDKFTKNSSNRKDGVKYFSMVVEYTKKRVVDLNEIKNSMSKLNIKKSSVLKVLLLKEKITQKNYEFTGV